MGDVSVHAQLIKKKISTWSLLYHINATFVFESIAFRWTNSYILIIWYVPCYCVEEIVSEISPLNLVACKLKLTALCTFKWVVGQTVFRQVIVNIATCQIICVITIVSCVLQTSVLILSYAKCSILRGCANLALRRITVWKTTLRAFSCIEWPAVPTHTKWRHLCCATFSIESQAKLL